MSEDPSKTMNVLSAPLGELIAAVGRGVAEAQQALDHGSLTTLQRLYATNDPVLESLRQIDYRPTFYTIPRVDSEMTVALTISVLDTKQIRAAPVDASYQSRYGYDIQAASKLRFSIVPVPPPPRAEQLRVVPPLVGRTWAECEAVLAPLELRAQTRPITTALADTVMVEQLPAAGTMVDAGTVVILTTRTPSTWMRVDTGHTQTIHAVSGDGRGNLWMVGREGTALESTDWGHSWHTIGLDTGLALYAVTSNSRGTLFATGQDGHVLRRRDAAWMFAQMPEFDDVAVNGIALRGDRILVVGARGHIAQSSDEGETWTHVPSGTASNLHAVAAGQAGFFAVGRGGVILRSGDGLAWTPMNRPRAADLFAVHVVAEGLAYAVGEEGLILRWMGSDWHMLESPLRANLYAVWTAGNEVFVAGRDGAMARSSDGMTFTAMPEKTTEAIHAGWGSADGRMVMVGTQGLCMRLD